MNLTVIVSKGFEHFRYENTAVMLCDYESRFVETDTVDFQAKAEKDFPIEVSPKSGQDFVSAQNEEF